MGSIAEPGRAAYEARFAHARPRDVEPWDSLTLEVKAIWARVEAAAWAAGAATARAACLKAAVSVSYGPPSSWPGDYPKGWRHPPCWEPDQRPTPDQAAWHDNGARDAWFAIRTLSPKAAPLPETEAKP